MRLSTRFARRGILLSGHRSGVRSGTEKRPDQSSVSTDRLVSEQPVGRGGDPCALESSDARASKSGPVRARARGSPGSSPSSTCMMIARARASARLDRCGVQGGSSFGQPVPPLPSRARFAAQARVAAERVSPAVLLAQAGSIRKGVERRCGPAQSDAFAAARRRVLPCGGRLRHGVHLARFPGGFSGGRRQARQGLSAIAPDRPRRHRHHIPGAACSRSGFDRRRRRR